MATQTQEGISLTPARRRRAYLPPPGRRSPAARLVARPAAWVETHRLPAAAGLAAVVWLMTAMALRSPGLVIGILFLIVLAVLFLRFPERALLVLLVLEPFHEAIYAALSNRAHLSVSVASLWKDGLIGALFARGLVDRVLERRSLRAVLSPGDRALLVYAFLMAVIAGLSPNLQNAGYALAIDVEGPLLFLAIVLLRPSRTTLRLALAAMLLSATVMGVTAVVEQGPQRTFDPWVGGEVPTAFSSFLLGDGSYRSGSFLLSPLHLAFYLAGAAAVATGVVIATRGLPRLLAGLATAACVAGLVVTFTRSGYIGGAFGVLVAAGLGVRNPRLRLALLGAIVVVVGSAAALSVVSGDEHVVHAGEGQGHLDILNLDLGFMSLQPLGYGLGQVDAVAQRFAAGGFATESTILSKGLQGGVEEVLAYCVVLFWTAMRLRAARRDALRAGDAELVGICAGAMGAQVAIFMAGLFLGVETLPVEVVLWGAPGIAIAMSHTSPGSGEPLPEPPAPPRARRERTLRASPAHRVTFWRYASPADGRRAQDKP